jgi:DNA-binding MarR family transcriptional regulator
VTNHASNPKVGRLLPIQEKVIRVAESVGKSAFARLRQDPDETAPVDIPEEAVDRMIRAWRARSAYLPSYLFADPAWAMLLELLHAELRGGRLSAAKLHERSLVAATSAERWLKALEGEELVVRTGDPKDPGQQLVALTRAASQALRHYVRDAVLPG